VLALSRPRRHLHDVGPVAHGQVLVPVAPTVRRSSAWAAACAVPGVMIRPIRIEHRQGEARLRAALRCPAPIQPISALGPQRSASRGPTSAVASLPPSFAGTPGPVRGTPRMIRGLSGIVGGTPPIVRSLPPSRVATCTPHTSSQTPPRGPSLALRALFPPRSPRLRGCVVRLPASPRLRLPASPRLRCPRPTSHNQGGQLDRARTHTLAILVIRPATLLWHNARGGRAASSAPRHHPPERFQYSACGLRGSPGRGIFAFQ